MNKFLNFCLAIALLLLLTAGQTNVNTGSGPNSKDGDSLRAAFNKINTNFTELYATTAKLAVTNVYTGRQEFLGTVTNRQTVKMESGAIIAGTAQLIDDVVVGGSITGVGSGLSQVPMSALVNVNVSAYAAGTVYTLTATPALVDFGTTDPSITLATAGTYLISGVANVKYTGATYAANQTATVKLRRTNNTAADLSNASRSITLRIITTITDDAGVVVIPQTVYVATAGDIIQMFGSVSATPSVGSVQVDSAEIVAIRIN